jgi:hypothetical protein
MEPMQRLDFVTYKGKKILVEDFSNMGPGGEFLAQLTTAKKMIAAQPPKSVLAVFDATGAHFDTTLLNSMKEFTKDNTPYVKAAAVVGISGMLQVALTVISSFAGRQFVTFKSREEAMEWLLKQ